MKSIHYLANYRGLFYDQSVQIEIKNTITDRFYLICYGLDSLVLNLFRFNVFLYHDLTVDNPTPQTFKEREMTSIVRFGRYQVVLLKRDITSPTLLVRFRVLLTKLNQYRQNAQQRRQLAQLPDYLLKDIGVTRADALKEAEKPFWK